MIGAAVATAVLIVAIVVAVVVIASGGKSATPGTPAAGANAAGSAGGSASTGGSAGGGSSAAGCATSSPATPASSSGAQTQVFDQLINYQDWAEGPATDPSKIFTSNVVQCGLTSPGCGTVSGIESVAAAYTSWQNDGGSNFEFDINADPNSIPISGNTSDVQTTFTLTGAPDTANKTGKIEIDLVNSGGTWLIDKIVAACA